jgi:hypothetical protein
VNRSAKANVQSAATGGEDQPEALVRQEAAGNKTCAEGFSKCGEFEAFLAKLPALFRPVVIFAYWFGWRMQTEKLWLTWRYVDLSEGMVRLFRRTTGIRPTAAVRESLGGVPGGMAGLFIRVSSRGSRLETSVQCEPGPAARRDFRVESRMISANGGKDPGSGRHP